ncbi:MAG TPA: GGDEF domain-containing protein [Chitinolyticbacter sp.]|nr:GGDEF domain-containing protein [Chitinolyticbacter sp.]
MNEGGRQAVWGRNGPYRFVAMVTGLMVVTLLLLAWHAFGMNRTLRLDADSTVPAVAIDDRSQGGTSTSRLIRSQDGVGVECHIRMKYQWPFCELALEIGEPKQGIDLSVFDTMALDIEYEGGAERIRVYLSNYDPAYSSDDKPVSNKINQLSYDPKRYPQGLTVGLDYFTVAGWWTEEMKLPLEHSQRDLRHVVKIELATGEIIEPGPYRIVLRSIEFRGKWLPASQLRLCIIALWLVAALVYLAMAFKRARGALVLARQRERDLAELNQSLQIKGEELEHVAHHDELTGALNRAGARDLLYDGSRRSQQDGRPMSLLFIDLDHFKQINDRYGHAAGDEILVHFTRVVLAATRSQDHLVRWGGEEFLLILSDATLPAAVQLAEKLRSALATARWPHADAVTASFGVAELKLERVQDCLERADAALYRAKQAGRNRVESAGA